MNRILIFILQMLVFGWPLFFVSQAFGAQVSKGSFSQSSPVKAGLLFFWILLLFLNRKNKDLS